MPVTRYEIRNEYSLADPELYRAADKDDPEALLEGVAMAGLVGVLRQLGDLAEFAAEIFHDLHEQVMLTAARGHGLVVRVQQLEAEVPSMERSFLSQTTHTHFFTNAGTGIHWHPTLHTKRNVLTHGDLPRCVMDSYEECRGPPRLFLLDKFDVAGAGACLKRYTDPSFVKADAASTTELYRDKKVRKAKKKGQRWRNGENPEVAKSHPKLQQLLLEERVENGISDPARLVKLKRRQLDDQKSGRSYMEKFLGTPSPENKMVRDISVAPLALKLSPDSSSESGVEVVDIKTMSSAEKPLEGKRDYLSSSPDHERYDGHVNDRRIVPVSELISDGENEEVFEKELLVDKGNIEGSIDGENSDNMTSEVENYMDALANIESELDTDTEYTSKNYPGIPNTKKGGTDSDGNEVQVPFSDSQSIENSSMSDDGNGSFKRGRSSFSCSDTLSNLAENVPSDSEAASNSHPSIETYDAISTDTSSINHHAYKEMSNTIPYELEDTKMGEVEGMSGMQGADSISVGSTENNSRCLNTEESMSLENSKAKSVEENLETDNIDETCTEKLGEATIDSPRSIISPEEDQFPHSAESPVEDLGSVSEAVTSGDLNSVVDVSEAYNLSDQQFSHYIPEEPEVLYSEEHTNPNCISTMADHSKEDSVDDLHSNPPDDPSCNDHVSSGAIVDDDEVSEDLICSSPSEELVHLEESLSGSADLLEEINVPTVLESSESVPRDGIHDSSLKKCAQSVELDCPNQSHLSENKDVASSPSRHLTGSIEIEVEAECQQAVEASSSHFLFDHNPTASEVSPESMGQEIDHTNNREIASLFSLLPSSDSLPQTSANEMPPMPPLQWRMGKVTHDIPDQQSPFLFPSLPLFSSHEDTHSGLPAFDSAATLPGNQVKAPAATKDVGPQYVVEELTNQVVQPTPLLSQEFHALGNEIPEPAQLFSTVPATEDSSSRQDAISSDESLIQPSQEIYMDNNVKADQLLTNDSEAEHSHPSDTASSSLATGEEQPNIQTSEGQLTWPSNAMALAPTFEVETPYGNTVPKIPRPRSPLVDALAAHDKSMLRKVTDRARARAQIEPKVEERDTLLQQIRTKSFNLRPALVSRPSIQGPKTNLRLAAILEKANAIRQATAGSDEDDDSWSDEQQFVKVFDAFDNGLF
ncbi:hypothetical protein ACFE04_003156 [Oxalis oulophora]